MMTESDCWHYANEVCGDCGYPVVACRCDPKGEEATGGEPTAHLTREPGQPCPRWSTCFSHDCTCYPSTAPSPASSGAAPTHADCGKGDAESGPDHSDCTHRGTAQQAECAAAGCGFCRAAGAAPEREPDLGYRIEVHSGMRFVVWGDHTKGESRLATEVELALFRRLSELEPAESQLAKLREAWRAMKAAPGLDETGSTRTWMRAYREFEDLMDAIAATPTPPTAP